MEAILVLALCFCVIMIVIHGLYKSYEMKKRPSEMERVSQLLNLTLLSGKYNLELDFGKKFKYFLETWNHRFPYTLIGNLKSNNNLTLFDQMIPVIFYYNLVTICYIRNDDIKLPNLIISRKTLLKKMLLDRSGFNKYGTFKEISKGIVVSPNNPNDQIYSIFDDIFIDKFLKMSKLIIETNGSEFIFIQEDKKIKEEAMVKFIHNCDSNVQDLVKHEKKF